MVKANKLYNNLDRGLITEATVLGAPEGSTSDELNMNMSTGGNRFRRWGLNYTSVSSPSISATGLSTSGVNEYRWVAANNDSTKNFVLVQIGLTIYIYDTSGTYQTSLDITSLVLSGQTVNATAQLLSFASGNGFVFCAGKYTEPFYITYTGSGFTITQLYVLIRDFVGVDDGLGPDEEPAALTNPHKYNLQNQGWVVGYNAHDGATITYWTAFGVKSTMVTSAASVIDSFHTDVGRYPSNNKLWWWAQKASFNIDGLALTNLPAGTILAPKGHYIVDAFNIDRSAVSAVSGIAVETISERPSTVSYFAGRVWWGCQSTVYFSRVLRPNKPHNANFCCMEADPTSQKISDLVATDGGTILINDIGTINRLYPVGSGMLVFGTNGVAFVQGGSGAFSATDFSVSKMSPIGMDAPNSVVEVDSSIFWMSYVGIQGMTQSNGIFGPIQGNFNKLNITLDTIQSWYTNNLPPSIRKDVKGRYDPSTNTIYWLYRSALSIYNQYDAALLLNLNKQAFLPWKFGYSSGFPYVVGAFQDLVATVTSSGVFTRPSQVTFLAVVPSGGNFNLAFVKKTDTTFVDWKQFDGIGVSYSSYLESAIEILQDAERGKWLPYLFAYLTRTETAVTTPDGGVTYVPDHPSSCLLTVKWDFSSSAVSNKWGPPTQVYRVLRMPKITGAGVIDNGYNIVTTKNKIRGKGKALVFRFASEAGKDFELLGWATEYAGNPTP